MKKIIYYFILVLVLLTPFSIRAQEVNGTVVDEKNTPLVNATIYFINSTQGTISDENGHFTINQTNIADKRLITSFIGFTNDTTYIKENNTVTIKLISNNDLSTIEITENKTGTYIDKESVVKNEIITKKELTKAACCDLAGCFETQASVKSETTNIITNSKELTLLGLSGTYNQILIDDHPMIEGSNYTYGISAIPGSLIEKITISQGLASVLQGPESITGQINILLKEYNENNKFFLNLYCNSFWAKQLNFDYSFKVGKWKSIAAVHTTQPANKIDHNNDTFLDLPQTTKYSFYNKWVYGAQHLYGLYTSITLRYLDEERIGGQIDFNPETDQGTTNTYGQVIKFSQPELHLKASYLLNNGNTIYLKSVLSTHDQKSYFGTTHYSANQLHYLINTSYALNWKTHKLTTGLDYKLLNLQENIFLNNIFEPYHTYSGDYDKYETRNGLFIENTFKWKNNIELITGIRFDLFNNDKIFTSPRMLLKYDFTEKSVGRISVGKGWRSFHTFSEHVKLFGSNRNLIISNDLEPEEAINLGTNFIQSFSVNNISFDLIVDFYKTLFSNHIMGDWNRSYYNIYVENFKGKTISNSFQIELGANISKSTALKVGYNYLDVFRMENDIKQPLPLIANHILTTLSYQPIDKNWSIDINGHWFGRKKLYNISNNPNDPYEGVYESPQHYMINSQFTQRIHDLDLYIGCENILNFTQENPILSWQEPFGEHFMSSNIWGPIRAREFYFGLRANF